METDSMEKIKGSSWNKWDYHVHSPESSGYRGTWQDFEKQLISAESEAIGINDYFSVAGYKKLISDIDSGKLDLGNKFIFPVVECRMSDSVQNRKTSKGVTHFNFHIIFDPTVNINEIETYIKSMKVNNSDQTIGEDYHDKDKLIEFKVSFSDEIKRLKENPKFENKFLILVPYSDYGGIDPIDPQSDGWIKGFFTKTANILGSANKDQIDFFLWKPALNKMSQDDLKKFLGVKKPCIKGSDSHASSEIIGRLKDSDSKQIEKYCWIKADLTFEGLKQIVFEPESRVYIGKDKPLEPLNCIESFTLNVEEESLLNGKDTFCFSGFNSKFELSPYLNVFIGGRGTGKSTLMNLFGIKSIYKDSAREFWEELDVSFSPEDSEIFSFEGATDFEFLAQSEIERIAANSDELTKIILQRLRQQPGSKIDDLKVDVKKEIDELTFLINDRESLNEAISQRKFEEEKLKSFRKAVEIIESEDFNLHKEELSKLQSEKQEYLDTSVKSKSLKNIIEDFKKENINFELPLAIDDIEKPSRKIFIEALMHVYSADALLERIDYSHLESEINSIDSKVEGQKNEISSMLQSKGLSSETIEQVSIAPTEINRLMKSIEEIDSKINAIEERLSTYNEIDTKIKKLKRSFKDNILGLIEPLEKKLDLFSSDKDKALIKRITFEYKFDEKKAWKDLVEDFVQHFKSLSIGINVNSLINYVMDSEVCSVINSGDYKTIKDFFWKENSSKKNANYLSFLAEVFQKEENFFTFNYLKSLYLNNVDEYSKIEVLYGGRTINRSSFGQRCTAVIVISILFGNSPLLIDEPETHLDSSFIANFLVDLIKKQKINRQIIFATHNANIVINGDAEKIFSLKEQEDCTTSIKEFTIENCAFREDLLNLEGGKQAFLRRGDKLSVK